MIVKGEPRPSANLGLFVSTYIGGGDTTPAASALKGVEAQVKLHTEFNPLDSTDTFSLLNEFGSILQIDISDLLNRSTDRPKTLTQYTDSLKNITARAKQTAQDLSDHGDTLNKDLRDAQSNLSSIRNKLDTAKNKNDFATAGALQKDLADAQTKVGEINAKEQENRDTLTTYQNLIAIADQRIKAIEQNREALIAGVKVMDIPGVDNLGVIQGRSSRAGGTSLFQPPPSL